MSTDCPISASSTPQLVWQVNRSFDKWLTIIVVSLNIPKFQLAWSDIFQVTLKKPRHIWSEWPLTSVSLLCSLIELEDCETDEFQNALLVSLKLRNLERGWDQRDLMGWRMHSTHSCRTAGNDKVR